MLWALLILSLPYISLSNPIDQPQQIVFHPDPVASLPVANSTKSFWIHTPNANVLANEGSTGPLTEDADICIIGSGMTGVSAAYHLAKSVQEEEGAVPVRVVVLEAREFCSGATGRNGGHLTPYSFFHFREYEEKYGTAEGLKSLRLENRTTMAMVKIIEQYGLADTVDLVAGGHLSLISSGYEYAMLRAEYLAAKRAGLDVSDVEWLSVRDVRSTYGASYPAVKFPAFNFWPLKFVTQLYLLANSSTPKLSLTLHTHTPVASVTPLSHSSSSFESPRWNLHTPRGDVHCTQVLHATNGYASHLLPQYSSSGSTGKNGRKGIIPTRGQIIAVRADTPINDSWRASWGGMDHYWFARPANGSDEDDDTESKQRNPLVLLGGGRDIGGPTFEQFITDDSVVNEAIGDDLRAFLPRTFPGMFNKETSPEMEWTGIMGYTSTTDPFVGPVIDTDEPRSHPNSNADRDRDAGLYTGQYIAAGYTGHGMPRAFSCAEAVASMILSAIRDRPWSAPEWLPERYLTWNRGEDFGEEDV